MMDLKILVDGKWFLIPATGGEFTAEELAPYAPEMAALGIEILLPGERVKILPITSLHKAKIIAYLRERSAQRGGEGE